MDVTVVCPQVRVERASPDEPLLVLPPIRRCWMRSLPGLQHIPLNFRLHSRVVGHQVVRRKCPPATPPRELHRRARRCSPPAGCHGRTSRGVTVTITNDAADAGGVAAGFDFGDAARMAAEFAPVLGGAPAGHCRHGCARAHAHAAVSRPC